MSLPTNKPPAWIDFKEPPVAKLAPANADETASLRSYFGRETRCMRLVFGDRFLRMYRVEPSRSAPLLVKLTTELRPETEYVCRLAAWLVERGVASPAPAILPTKLPNPVGGFIHAYDFVEHRPLSPRDLPSTARALVRLHQALATHPDVALWRANTDRRVRRLNRIRSHLASGQLKSGPSPSRLRDVAGSADVDFERFAAPRSATHGDLTLGNLVFGTTDQRVYILDLEDVVHSATCLEYDLALVLERLVFARCSNDEQVFESGAEFLDAYAGALGSRPFRLTVALHEAILALNLRSLCILASLEAAGVTTAAGEWNKFFELFDDARARRSLWNRLGEAGGSG